MSASVMLGGGPGLMLLSFGFLPHWFDAWLSGDFFLVAALLTVGSIAVLARVPGAVRKVSRRAVESGMASVAGFSDLIQAQQQRVQRLHQKRQESGGRMIVDLPASLDEKLRSLPVARGQRQLALLRAASGFNSRFMLKFAVTLFVLTACMAFGASVISGQPWDSRKMLRVAVAPVCMMGLVPGLIVVAGWRIRMTVFFGLELLRPVSRSAMRRLLFQSIALDLAPFCVLVCLLATGLAVLSGYGATALAITAMFASIGPLFYGVGLWFVLIRRTWLAILIGVVLPFAWQINTALLIQGRQVVASTLVLPTLLALLIGFAATGLAWRYWSRREMF